MTQLIIFFILLLLEQLVHSEFEVVTKGTLDTFNNILTISNFCDLAVVN